jgi:hypothetical protein
MPAQQPGAQMPMQPNMVAIFLPILQTALAKGMTLQDVINSLQAATPKAAPQQPSQVPPQLLQNLQQALAVKR